MTTNLQLGTHLDPDQLAALLENALPAPEREQTLAHLALCPDCRHVLALTATAYELEAPAIEVAPPELAPAARIPAYQGVVDTISATQRPSPKPAKPGWFSGWGLLWPATAGLAAILSLTFALHRQPAIPPVPANETARATPPPPLPEPVPLPQPPALTSAAPLPPAKAAIVLGTPQPLAPGAALDSKRIEELPLENRNVQMLKPKATVGQGAATPGVLGGMGAAASPQQAPNNFLPGQQAQTTQLQLQNQAAVTGQGQLARAQDQDRPNLPQDQAYGYSQGSAARSTTQLSAQKQSAAPVAGSVRGAAAASPQPVQLGSGTPSASHSATQNGALAPPKPVPLLAQNAAAPLPQPAAVARAIAPAPPAAQSTMEVSAAASAISTENATTFAGLVSPTLPSHKPVQSITSAGPRTLALDTAGALFLSTDSGRHFHSVRASWPGRATAVAPWTEAPIPATPQPVIVAAAAPPSPPKQPPPAGQSTTTATLTGSVTDATGAAIPKAALTLTGGTTRTLTADTAGRFTFTGLLPGPYFLEARYPGFATTRQTLTLAPAEAAHTDLRLSAAFATETVTVSAETNSKRRRTPPSPLFTLTTEGGTHWTSPDGKTWTQSR